MTASEIKDVKKFLFKLLIFFVLLFICDRFFGTIVETLYNKRPQGDIANFRHSVKDPKEDIVIYGSSRGVHTYVTELFTDSFGLSCFNSSRQNSNILYHSVIMPMSISKYKPKLIILDITPKEFTFRSGENSKLVMASMILPYVRRDEDFKKIAETNFPEELRKAQLSKLYAYNSYILPTLQGLSVKTDMGKPSDVKQGYLPLRGTRIGDSVPPPYQFDDAKEMDTFARNQFEKFIKTVLDNNIKLVAVMSPLYIAPFKDTKSMVEYKRILSKYNVPYFHYASDPVFLKQKCFYDYVHMNDKGARQFTDSFIVQIKKYLGQDDAGRAILKYAPVWPQDSLKVDSIFRFEGMTPTRKVLE
jgi:hypothetical protein